jgi:hypothetical protein
MLRKSLPLAAVSFTMRRRSRWDRHLTVVGRRDLFGEQRNTDKQHRRVPNNSSSPPAAPVRAT